MTPILSCVFSRACFGMTSIYFLAFRDNLVILIINYVTVVQTRHDCNLKGPLCRIQGEALAEMQYNIQRDWSSVYSSTHPHT